MLHRFQRTSSRSKPNYNRDCLTHGFDSFFFVQLDGNVSRLISRLLAIHAPPKSKASLDLLWQGAQTMVEGATCAGDVNQALIELGSTVCRLRDPDCSGCPLRQWCRAYQISEQKVAAV